MYPRRNFTFLGRYNITETLLSSGVSLLWDADSLPRSITAGIDWETLDNTHPHHRLELRLEHPSFTKVRHATHLDRAHLLTDQPTSRTQRSKGNSNRTTPESRTFKSIWSTPTTSTRSSSSRPGWRRSRTIPTTVFSIK